MINLLSKGAAGSSQLVKRGPKILKRDFEPDFYVEHFVKDLSIALSEAERAGLQLPAMTQAKKFFEMYVEQGGGKNSTHGLIQVLEKMNNM
jgi:3-hydroxyisobutyrate dehydrogenase